MNHFCVHNPNNSAPIRDRRLGRHFRYDIQIIFYSTLLYSTILYSILYPSLISRTCNSVSVCAKNIYILTMYYMFNHTSLN